MEALKPIYNFKKVIQFFSDDEYSIDQHYQRYFILSLAVILLVGLMMVYSASYIYAKEQFGSSTFFVFKQSLFMAELS